MAGIADFDITTAIYEGANTNVFRAVRMSDNQPVILKTTSNAHPSPNEMARYRHEYHILKFLKPNVPKHVVQVLDLVVNDHRPYLVMEDFGGVDLGTLKLKRSELDSYAKTASDSSNLILKNLSGAVKIVQGFKQVAVDQTSGERREFKLKAYIEDVLLSLKPKLKKTKHKVTVSCPEDLTLDSFPGALSQIISNLVMNSLIHGFEGIEQGEITFDAAEDNGSIILTYRDDGRGMGRKTLSRILDPFFTTKRSQGGSGLGMHIVHNLVTQTLGGTISCKSKPKNGIMIRMQIPVADGR